MSEHQNNERDNRAVYQQDTVMSHEFDGIQEFDNRLPNWWMWLMYGSIVFALFYWIVFHTLGIGEMPHQSFEADMLAAQEAQLERAAAQGLDNDMFVMMAGMEARVDEGREVWKAHCVACHLDDGRGSVGPNMTDNFWVHGCEPMQMYKTITEGVPSKGMPAWMNQLGPSRVQAAVAYLLTIKDTNIEGKAPEGEPCSF
jgi:cytochrome c oxidase cbb3-type subunit 3